MVNMMARAKKNIRIDREISGANARNIWSDRMSELAREMSWPDWTRS